MFHGIAGGQHRREAGIEELLHSFRCLLLQPALRIPLHDVTVGIDKSGHDCHALGVNGAVARWYVFVGYRADPPTVNDNCALFDYLARAIDNPRVGNNQVLCTCEGPSTH